MGSDRHYPEEAPAHHVHVDGFWIDRTPVTNAQFRRFVEATGYVTFAEIAPDPNDYPGALPELLVPGSVVFTPPRRPVDLRNFHNWWQLHVRRQLATPHGPGSSSIDGLDDHPVVHVAYRGRRRPTRAGPARSCRPKPSGSSPRAADSTAPSSRGATSSRPAAEHMANTWQGEFPEQNLQQRRLRRARRRCGSFPPNGYGLYDMIGNVWEWTTDWYRRSTATPATRAARRATRAVARENELRPVPPQIQIPRKVMKGGSYLCAPNYCRRYRPAARMAQPIDTSTCHLGFRCVRHDPAAAD